MAEPKKNFQELMRKQARALVSWYKKRFPNEHREFKRFVDRIRQTRINEKAMSREGELLYMGEIPSEINAVACRLPETTGFGIEWLNNREALKIFFEEFPEGRVNAKSVPKTQQEKWQKTVDHEPECDNVWAEFCLTNPDLVFPASSKTRRILSSE